MYPREPFELTLPPQAVVNATFDFDDKLAAARRFLSDRGIREVRPVYGSAALPKRHAIRGTVSRLEIGRAANDAADISTIEETAA
jgi:hypothetical protein